MNDGSFEKMHLTGRDYWWYQAKEHLMHRLLLRAGTPPQPDRKYRILDIGSGTGTMFGFLAEYGTVTGLEPSERAVGYAECRNIARMVRGDAARAPFGKDVFDLITLFDSLEHMEDDRAALANAREMICPGGILLVTVPAFQWLRSWRETQLGHRRRYTVHSLRRLLESAGFSVDLIHYMYAGLFPLLVLKSLKDRVIPPPRVFKSDIVMLREPWNSFLAGWFCAEAVLCERVGLPLGTSVVALAHRPVDSGAQIHKDKQP